MTLECEDANSNLIEVVSVADVDDEKRVGNSLVQIRKMRFGNKYSFCSDFEHNVWSRFYFKVEVQAKFEAGVWSVFCC